MLQTAFTHVPILKHFELTEGSIYHRYAKSITVAGIVNQYDGFDLIRFVTFHSGQCPCAEQNCDMNDRNLLAIVDAMNYWHPYLQGVTHKILTECHHKNLKYCQISKVLSQCQARWAEILSPYDYHIKHLECNKNPADGPSRRPNHHSSYGNIRARLLANLAATNITGSYVGLLLDSKAPQEIYILHTYIRPILSNVTLTDETQSKSIGGALT